LFETVGVPFATALSSAVCTLASDGKEEGCLVEVGHSYSSIVPVTGLAPVHEAVSFAKLGGRDVTDELARVVREQRGFELEPWVARLMKEAPGTVYVAQDFDREVEVRLEVTG
jgi:actin-related protein